MDALLVKGFNTVDALKTNRGSCCLTLLIMLVLLLYSIYGQIIKICFRLIKGEMSDIP